MGNVLSLNPKNLDSQMTLLSFCHLSLYKYIDVRQESDLKKITLESLD